MKNHKEIICYNGKVKIYQEDGIWNGEPTHKFFDSKGNTIDSVTKYLKHLNKEALKFWAGVCSAEYIFDNWDENKTYGKEMIKEIVCKASFAFMNILKEKGGRGKEIHKFAEEYIKGNKPAIPDDPKILNGVNSFLGWYKETDLIPVETEKILYSLKHNIVGVGDLIAKRKKGNTNHIVDYKTVSMYKKAKNWESEQFPDGLWKDEQGNRKKYPVFIEPRIQVAIYRGMSIEETGKKFGDSYILRFDQETGDFDNETISAEFQDEAYEMFTKHLKPVSKFLNKYEVKY